MAVERLRLWLLAGAGISMIAIYAAWPARSNLSSTPTRTERARAASTPAAATAAPDVHLETLNADTAKPGPATRNLFRFRPRPVPQPAQGGIRSTTPPPPMAPAAPPVPQIPPIGLRFIGIFQSARMETIAVLSDGRGAPIYGKEGDIVLGQYKILRIGVESIDMAYLDGQGRQTIRLSGS